MYKGKVYAAGVPDYQEGYAMKYGPNPNKSDIILYADEGDTIFEFENNESIILGVIKNGKLEPQNEA